MKLRSGVWAILVILLLCFAVDLICDEDHGADFGQELEAYAVPQPPRELLTALPVLPAPTHSQEPPSPGLVIEDAPAPALPARPYLEGPSGLSPPRSARSVPA